MHSTRILLATLVLGLYLVTGLFANAANIPFFVYASTDEGGEDEGGGSEGNGNEGNNDGGSDEGEGGDEGSEQPEPEPEPTPGSGPVPTTEPIPETAIVPLVPEPTEPEPIKCPAGLVLSDINTCVPEEEPSPALPICDGTFQDCITPNGDMCLAGQGGHECECAEDMGDCPNHPSLPPPLESPSPKPLPYCDKIPDDYTGACHDRKDIDEITGLYPCNDGTQEVDWRDCLDATEPGDSYCQALGCPGSSPDPISGCMDGRDPVNGKCPYPKPPEPEPKCPPGWKYREKQDDCHKDITIIINKIIKETNEGKHNDGFPDVDVIGLSVKQDGHAMICAMDIDNSWVQCQEFGMDPQKVNQAFWRVIETDHDKDYDNGNTGSNNVDLAIEDIKAHDFEELDDDRDNNDFGVDLAWIAINPVGEGVTCLSEDSTGKGKSLCEPFKVSSTEIDGQITEGIAIS